jgi:phosphoglycolate phosphatase-like HAD superfamily hydrolase
VFDFDGVLLESNTVKRDAFFAVFEEWRRPDLVAQCLDAHRGDTRTEIVGGIVDAAIRAGLVDPATPVDSLKQDFVARYSERCHLDVMACPEVPGMRACLDHLVTRVPLYVNSATPQAPLDRLIRGRGLDRYFKGVLGVESGKVPTLRKVMDAEGVAPDAVVFVGDAEGDRRAAAACGCRFAGMKNESNDFAETPDIIIDRLDQLLAVDAWRWPS